MHDTMILGDFILCGTGPADTIPNTATSRSYGCRWRRHRIVLNDRIEKTGNQNDTTMKGEKNGKDN